GVDRVMTSSASPPRIARAIAFDVAASPSALYRRTRIVRPSWYPDSANPAITPRTPSSRVACETWWNNATERTLPDDPSPVSDDPDTTRGRSRSVSSNRADAARIKSVASHSRTKILFISGSGGGGTDTERRQGDGSGPCAGLV